MYTKYNRKHAHNNKPVIMFGWWLKYRIGLEG